MKKVAIILSGCGNKEGTEVTEAVSLIISLSQLGAKVQFFSPENLMTESARISRGEIQDLKSLDAEDFDALAIPGGKGAIIHLCNWSVKGSECEVNPDLAKAIQKFYTQGKPIAAICIAPVIVAKVLGKNKITVTLGSDPSALPELAKTGAIHEDCDSSDYISDRSHKVITTPAYMDKQAKAHTVYLGISGLAKELMEMA